MSVVVCKQCGSHRSDVHKCFQCEYEGSVDDVIAHGVAHHHLGGHCLLELPSRRSTGANAGGGGLTVAAAAVEAKRKRYDDDDGGDNYDNNVAAASPIGGGGGAGEALFDDDFASVPAASAPKVSPFKSQAVAAAAAAASSSSSSQSVFQRFLAEKALLDAAHSGAVAKLARARRAEIHVASLGCAVCGEAADVGVSDALLEHCSACHRSAHQRCSRKGWAVACRECGGRWCAECEAFARPAATICVCGACAFCIGDEPAVHRQHVRHAARAYVVLEKK